MTELSTEAPALIATGTQALVENAGRLGLVWNMRPATISTFDPDEGVTGILDGDEESIGLVSLIGPVAAGFRVMVCQVPPGGNFIIGPLAAYNPGWGVVGSHTETVNQGPITSLTTVMTTDEACVLRPGRAYEFTTSHSHFSSGAGVLAQYAVSTTSGAFSIGLGNFRTEGGASTAVHASIIGINLGSSAITDTVELHATALSGNITMFGSASFPRQFWVKDVGPAYLFEDFFEL